MFLIESVLYTFLLTETLATFVGISVLGGIIWRRANRWGALASLLSALATNFLLYYLTGERLDYWDPNVFLAALVVGIVALVVVSLLTRPEPADAIESFFGRLQTSSDDATAEAGRGRRTGQAARCCSSTCCACAAPRQDADGGCSARISAGWRWVAVLVVALVCRDSAVAEELILMTSVQPALGC